MNVASLENCKRLYELSEWDNSEWVWAVNIATGKPVSFHHSKVPTTYPYEQTYHAYDLGYLIRKFRMVDLQFNPELYFDKWHIRYGDQKTEIRLTGDTPEDVACLLAIKLFEEGILTK